MLRAITLRIELSGWPPRRRPSRRPRPAARRRAPPERRAGPRREPPARPGRPEARRARRRAAAGAAGAAWPPAMNFSTSFFVTRPPRPVPGMAAMSRPCSAHHARHDGRHEEPLVALAVGGGRGLGLRRRLGGGLRGRGLDDRALVEVRRARLGLDGRDERLGAGGRVGRERRSLGGGGAAAPAGPRPRARRAPTGGAAARVDDRDARVDGDGLAFGHEDLDDGAGGGRGHLGVDLVGRDLDDGLVGGDLLADLLDPARDGALRDAHAHLGHDDVDERGGGHDGDPLFSLSRPAASARPRRRRRPAG